MIQLVQRNQSLTPKSRQRIYYSDFSRDFALNPITGYIVVLTNEQSISSALENLAMTGKGERFYHSEIGGNIDQLLFEPVDNVTSESLKTALEQSIQSDSRVSSVEIIVTPYPSQNYYDISIIYTDVNNQTQRVSFPLSARVR